MKLVFKCVLNIDTKSHFDRLISTVISGESG